MRSPQTPLRRPQNGTQAHDLSRQLEFGRPGSGRRYPVLGPPFSAFGDNQIGPYGASNNTHDCEPLT